MRRWLAVVPLASCLVAASARAQELQDLPIETTHLAGSVWHLTSHAGGNLAACVGEDGVLLVDAEYEQLAPKVVDALAEIGDEPIAFVVDTHWHFDHVGGNALFAAAGARIVAHENVRRRMAVDQHIGILDVDVPASPPEALPVITFADSITFHLNGEEITVFHVPAAHTDGDAIVRFRRADVIHVGDLVFQGGYPFIDVTAGGSIDGVIAGLERVLPLCDGATTIIPGHGPVGGRDELAAYVAMLREFRSAVAAEMEAGKDLPAILEAGPTAELDAVWNRQFPAPVFTEIVYRSLGGE